MTAAETIVTVLREEIGALRGAIRDLVAEQQDILTPEQAAERLSISVTKVTRAMNRNVLPRGVVWFETPLGRYLSWRRLMEWITTSGASIMSVHDEAHDEDDVWRKPA